MKNFSKSTKILLVATVLLFSFGFTLNANAASWVSSTTPNNETSSSTYGGGLYILAGDGKILNSADGVSWNMQYNGGSDIYGGVAYSGSAYIAVANNCSTIIKSSNGVVWAPVTGADLDCASLLGVAYGGGLFVAVGSGVIETSPDGTTWTAQTSFNGLNLFGVAYGGGTFVAVGSGGVIGTSPDGATWTEQTGDTGQTLTSVTYAGGLFIAVGANGVIETSPNGINWTSRTSGVGNNLNSVTYGNGLFVAVGDGGKIVGSSDGINWGLQPSGTGNNLKAVVFGADKFIAGGDTDTIFTLLYTDPEPPSAEEVSITGSATTGGTLTGNYTYSDFEGDVEGTSTFKWYRDDVAIDGATSDTYIVTSDDIGKDIQFEVTPVAATGDSPGDPVKSDAVVPHVAGTLTVTSLLDDGDGTCTVESCTFRDAIANAIDGDTIEFGSSVRGTILLTDDPADYIYVEHNINIVGPGQDVLTIDFNSQDYNLIEFDNVGEVNISGLTFTNASNTVLYYGGDDSSVYNISDSTFINNNVYAPIYIEYGNWNFTNVTFSNNSAEYYGGAIYVYSYDGMEVSVTNSTFTNNSSMYDYGYGGAIYYEVDSDSEGVDTLSVTNSTFVSNSTDGYGGAIAAYGDIEVDIANSTFANNTSDYYAGSVYTYGYDEANLNITDSTFTNNQSQRYGAVKFDTDGDVTIRNSIFDGNEATDYIGAFGGFAGSVTISNSTISNNTNISYGALYVDSDTTIITNSTFYNNHSSDGFGGAISSGDFAGSMTVKNSTFSGNTSSNGGADIYVYGTNDVHVVNSILSSGSANNCFAEDDASIVSLGHNIDSGTSCGFEESGDLSSTNPLLDTGGLKDNGGDVETIALLKGSPAIDAGSDADAPDTDARGITRPQGKHADMGAYELAVVRKPNVGGSSSGAGAAYIAPPVAVAPTDKPADCLSTYKFSPSTGKSCTGVSNPSTPNPSVPSGPSATTLIKLGAKGDEVKKLQTLLHLTADGIFGPKTKAAVIVFQKSHGLVPDGVVGPKTLSLMQ